MRWLLLLLLLIPCFACRPQVTAALRAQAAKRVLITIDDLPIAMRGGALGAKALGLPVPGCVRRSRAMVHQP